MKDKRKNIFITGGAGYVGAVLVPHLLEKDYSVTVMDLMIYGDDVLPKHPNLQSVKGDIRDQTLLKELIPGHDAVIHLACISNDPSFELNPELGKSINLDAFRPLVEISKNSGLLDDLQKRNIIDIKNKCGMRIFDTSVYLAHN